MNKIVKRLAFARTVAFASGSGRVPSMVGRHGLLSLVGAAGVTSALLLVSISSAASSALSEVDSTSLQQPGHLTSDLGRHTMSAPRTMRPARLTGQEGIRWVLRTYAERGLGDHQWLKRELSAVGATNVRISAPALESDVIGTHQAESTSALGGRTVSYRPVGAARAQPMAAPVPAQSPQASDKCDSPHFFICELILFHFETRPPEPGPDQDQAVLMWNLFDSFHDQPRQGESARNSEVDDVAAIGFSEYDPECYGDPKEDWWAAAFDNSTVDNTLIGRVHNDTRGSTAFGVETDSPSPMNPLPRIDHGYVSVALPHTFEPGGKCSDFEEQELSAVGKYVHHEDGEGAWSATFSAGAGPAQASISYTGATPPNKPEVRVAGPVSVHQKFDPQGDSRPIVPTHLTYTGPTEARFHEQFTASARLTISSGPNAGQPIPDAPLRFRLGFGGDTQSCTATTNGSGVASCPLTPAQEGGRTTLTVQFNQRGEFLSSSVFVPFTIIRQATEVAYTGPTRVANGTPARLSGVLQEKGGPPIEGRKLRLTLGSGKSQQACTGTTNASGTARCAIRSVDQPLNAAATVPVQVRFAGDPYYLPSSKSAAVLLEYYTGRAYGLTATIGLPLVPLVSLSPTPDTGHVRTARASESTTPCVAEVDAAVLLTAGVVCPKVTTRLAPGTSTSTATVEQTRIGIPGLPVIEVRGGTAKSTSTCGSGGSATGNTGLELYIAGRRIPVTTEVNAEIDLPGAVRLVINEQKPVAGADHGLTVNAAHLTTAGGDTDIVIASATSDVHNCA